MVNMLNKDIHVDVQNVITKRFTLVPSVEPTMEPIDQTLVPTSDPTTGPTDEPTSSPSADPSFHPTQDPTLEPTKEPTTICEPYESCTECLNVNSVVPDCFWHITYQRCYHYNELDGDEAVISDGEECTDSKETDSIAVIQWTVISVVFVMVASAVLFLLQRYHKKRAGNDSDDSNATELTSHVSNIVQSDAVNNVPGQKDQEPSLSEGKEGSRREGMEMNDGNTTDVRKESEV